MPDPIDFTRQLRAHLESLAQAGVTFVPRGEPLAFALRAAAEAESVAERRPIRSRSGDTNLRCWRTRSRGATAARNCSRRGRRRSSASARSTPELASSARRPAPTRTGRASRSSARRGSTSTRIINGCGFTREEVYIFNMLKCRPPGAAGSGSSNRQPTPEECANCRPFFERQFDLVRPKHVVALGGTAAKALLNTATGITRLRGKVYDFRGVPLICTFHPSALLRDDTGRMKRDVWEDMKLLLRTMGRPIPK